MSDTEVYRPTAYERVVGKAENPKDDDDENKDETIVLEKTRTEIFFEGLLALTDNPIFGFIVMTAVIFNTIALILLTFPELAARISYSLQVLDSFFLGIYLAEAVIKMVAMGVGYFHGGWNLLDFFILITSGVDFVIGFLTGSMGSGGSSFLRILRIFRAMRALRALRMLRTITLLHNLQVIVQSILESINSMAVIGCLMLLFMYMFAVMGRQLYSAASPYYFGDLFRCVTTMFQLLTFDSWFYMYDDVNLRGNNWHFILYAIAYSLIEYFILLNLFTAVLVDNFQRQLKSRKNDEKKEPDLEAELELDKNKNENKEPVKVDADKTPWPQGSPTMHYNPYMADFGHLPLDQRIMYVQFYRALCALDYWAYIQKQNKLMMTKLLDTCQDPRLLHNSQADEK